MIEHAAHALPSQTKSNDVIEDSGMERSFELAPGFMSAGPKNMGATPFKARQHDPERIAAGQLHEALEAEAADRQISDMTPEPGFARASDLDGYTQVASLGQATVPTSQVDLILCTHADVASLIAIIADQG